MYRLGIYRNWFPILIPMLYVLSLDYIHVLYLISFRQKIDNVKPGYCYVLY